MPLYEERNSWVVWTLPLDNPLSYYTYNEANVNKVIQDAKLEDGQFITVLAICTYLGHCQGREFYMIRVEKGANYQQEPVAIKNGVYYFCLKVKKESFKVVDFVRPELPERGRSLPQR